MEFQLPSSSSNAYNVEVHQGFDKSSEDEMIKAALLHEVVDTRNKTPVSLLHELLSKRGRTPKYELVQTEGVIHEPIFRYRVSFANEDALGTGTSKKEAKHNAARDLLKKLCNNIDLDFDTPAKDGNAEDNDETTRNPIGRLQELCILRRWTPPIYDTEKEIGQAHNKNFVMVCKVAQFQEEGEGSSKKIAKRKAAFKMLKFLTTMNEESLENGIETSIINRYNDIKDLNFKKMGPNSKKDFEQAFAKMRTDTTPGIVELQKDCLRSPEMADKLEDLLNRIAKENNFDVQEMLIDEKTILNEFQYVFQLSTNPVGIVQGSGKTKEEARTMGILNTLEFIKLMTN